MTEKDKKNIDYFKTIKDKNNIYKNKLNEDFKLILNDNDTINKNKNENEINVCKKDKKYSILEYLVEA